MTSAKRQFWKQGPGEHYAGSETRGQGHYCVVPNTTSLTRLASHHCTPSCWLLGDSESNLQPVPRGAWALSIYHTAGQEVWLPWYCHSPLCSQTYRHIPITSLAGSPWLSFSFPHPSVFLFSVCPTTACVFLRPLPILFCVKWGTSKEREGSPACEGATDTAFPQPRWWKALLTSPAPSTSGKILMVKVLFVLKRPC